MKIEAKIADFGDRLYLRGSRIGFVLARLLTRVKRACSPKILWEMPFLGRCRRLGYGAPLVRGEERLHLGLRVKTVAAPCQQAGLGKAAASCTQSKEEGTRNPFWIPGQVNFLSEERLRGLSHNHAAIACIACSFVESKLEQRPRI